ncbi:MAG: DNA-directed RNA polymerase subunit alpha [Deltaproteobacteria bacterium]|nr:DNA-directed RNA polymerase subunit alpha [Deltaproteobacteria bacterium]
MQKNWRDLIKPKKLEVEKETLTNTYGKFVAEPLERGFGVTIGNSLRRILLSSLQGAAITNVKIDGVLHEFSSVPGVKEDVSDIILNLKQVKLRIHGDGPKTLRIKGTGPHGVVTAKEIICDSTVEILNPSQHIATVSKDAKFDCELIANQGKGYVPAERNKLPETTIGMIAIDSVFQPVTRVNFNVTHARVGQRTDYDKLVLELWTSGAIDPLSAVAIAAKIFKDQLSVFITFEEEAEAFSDKPDANPQFNEHLFKTVDEMELSVRSANCLKNADIKYIGEMVQKTEQEMLRTKNFGRKSLNEIKELLHNMGLDFGMNVDNFPSRKSLDSMRTTEVKEPA